MVFEPPSRIREKSDPTEQSRQLPHVIEYHRSRPFEAPRGSQPPAYPKARMPAARAASTPYWLSSTTAHGNPLTVYQYSVAIKDDELERSGHGGTVQM
jgi:hypothetical protein